MASSLLRSITDFLESGMDEEINNLYDSTLGDSCEDLEISQHRNSRSLELRSNMFVVLLLIEFTTCYC